MYVSKSSEFEQIHGFLKDVINILAMKQRNPQCILNETE